MPLQLVLRSPGTSPEGVAWCRPPVQACCRKEAHQGSPEDVPASARPSVPDLGPPSGWRPRPYPAAGGVLRDLLDSIMQITS